MPTRNSRRTASAGLLCPKPCQRARLIRPTPAASTRPQVFFRVAAVRPAGASAFAEANAGAPLRLVDVPSAPHSARAEALPGHCLRVEWVTAAHASNMPDRCVRAVDSPHDTVDPHAAQPVPTRRISQVPSAALDARLLPVRRAHLPRAVGRCRRRSRHNCHARRCGDARSARVARRPLHAAHPRAVAALRPRLRGKRRRRLRLRVRTRRSALTLNPKARQARQRCFGGQGKARL